MRRKTGNKKALSRHNINNHCTVQIFERFLEKEKGMEDTPEAVDIDEKKRRKKELAEQKRAQKYWHTSL